MNVRKIGQATIHNCDCMEFIKNCEDNQFDLAIVDPPYGIGVNSMNMGGRKNVKPDNRKWDESIPDDSYFNELERVSKKQIIWGGNYFDLRPTRCFIIWDKGESMYGRSFAECEQAWTNIDASARMVKINPNQPNRFHPTQKPVALYEWLLHNYANTGDSILDTHMGSGSIAIATNKHGFDLTACELDPDYFKSACERIQKANSQPDMFTPVPAEPKQGVMM